MNKTIGYLLIAGAVGVLIPYTLLTLNFHYPQVLRQPAGHILIAFNQRGAALIFTWLAFALAGLPLLAAYQLIGRRLEQKNAHAAWATTLGISGGILQIIGLSRWVFVVPVLATEYIHADAATKAAIVVSFKTIHQFAGVMLGEHLGQLLTIIYTVLISHALYRQQIIKKWLAWFGYGASIIYLLAQGELLATVIPGFNYWEPAGFAGSTLWLLWLILLGVHQVREKKY